MPIAQTYHGLDELVVVVDSSRKNDQYTALLKNDTLQSLMCYATLFNLLGILRSVRAICLYIPPFLVRIALMRLIAFAASSSKPLVLI